MKFDNPPFVDDDGYLLVHHQGKDQYVHRLVMEEILGRKLEDWEIVHHKDENKQNCEPWNLELTNRPDHGRHHMIGNAYRKGKPITESAKAKQREAMLGNKNALGNRGRQKVVQDE